MKQSRSLIRTLAKLASRCTLNLISRGHKERPSNSFWPWSSLCRFLSMMAGESGGCLYSPAWRPRQEPPQRIQGCKLHQMSDVSYGHFHIYSVPRNTRSFLIRTLSSSFCSCHFFYWTCRLPSCQASETQGAARAYMTMISYPCTGSVALELTKETQTLG